MNISENNSFNSFKTNNAKKILKPVKIKNIGTASLKLMGDKLIIQSSDSQYTFHKSLDYLDFLLFSEGNFFLKDKFIIGIDGNQFEISCIENETDFRTFYSSIKTRKTKNSSTVLKELPKDTPVNDNIISEEHTEETSINVSEEIRNFYNLMKDGIISEEEFEEKKKELLKIKIK